MIKCNRCKKKTKKYCSYKTVHREWVLCDCCLKACFISMAQHDVTIHKRFIAYCRNV